MSRRLAVVAAVAVVLAALPIYLESFWLQTGLFAMASIIAAIGLTILVGTAGQLSLAHAFFVAIGAYGYSFLAGQEVPGADGPAGLGLPPLLALIGAVLAGRAGRRAVQPDLGPRARDLSRAREPGPGLPRPAHPPERDRDHRRLPRRRRAAVQPVRLQLLEHEPGRPRDPGRAVRDAGAALVRRPGARRRVAVVRPQPRRAAGRGARWRRSATARSRPRPMASTSSATRRPRSPCRRCTRGSAAC